MDEQVPERCRVDAWAPSVPGVAEVFHARIVDYAYPPHCHDTWTVLIVDDGAIRYDLDTRHCGAAGQTVTILPPWVVHDGRPASGTHGFRKRNLYLDEGFLPTELIGPAVDHTNIDDPQLRRALVGLHDSLVEREDSLDGEARLALIGERIAAHLTSTSTSTATATATTMGRATRRPHEPPAPEPGIAERLRELLDEHTVVPLTLGQAATLLDRSVPHLVRSFTRRFGVSPHAYVVGRRIDEARRRLLRGTPPADVATAVGFYDQAHLTRHFRRHTSTTPARYAASHT